MANFAKNHWGKIVLITSAVVLAGLIAAPFIWNATKTVEFLKDSVKYIQSLIEKTGLSNLALGGILAGIIAAIGVMTLIAMYIAGRKLPKGVESAIEAEPTSLTIENDTITINYNKADLESTEVFVSHETDLQNLLNKNISEKVKAQAAVAEVKDTTTGAVITPAQAKVEAKAVVPCTDVIFDMGNLKWKDQNAQDMANKLYRNIDKTNLNLKTVVTQFKDYYDVRDGTGSVPRDGTGSVFTYPGKAPNSATTRTVQVTLSENKAVDNRNMANKVHDGINTCINMTVLKCVADDKKLKMAQAQAVTTA